MTNNTENELRESPKRQNGNAAIIMSAFGICALVCLVSQIIKIGNGIVSQILLLVFAAAFVFIYVKSYLTMYEYVLMRDDNGDVYFAVVQVKGRRKLTLICVPVSAVRKIITYNRTTDTKRPKIPSGRRVNYCISVLPYKYQLSEITVSGNTVTVQTEMSDGFLSVFKNLTETSSESGKNGMPEHIAEVNDEPDAEK